MVRTRYLKYVFSNGDIKFLTPSGAIEYSDKHNTKIEYDGYQMKIKHPPRIHDGFKKGYQIGLGMEVNHYDEYKRICKSRGLAEMGNEKLTFKKDPSSKYIDDKVLKDAIDKGAEISGREAQALKDGVKLHQD